MRRERGRYEKSIRDEMEGAHFYHSNHTPPTLREWYKRNGLVIALAGNKRDLAMGGGVGGIRGEDLGDKKGGPKRCVSEAEASDFASQEGMLFFETSAKMGNDEGVQKMFQDLVFWVNIKMEREGLGMGRGKDDESEDGETVSLSMPKSNTKCC